MTPAQENRVKELKVTDWSVTDKSGGVITMESQTGKQLVLINKLGVRTFFNK